jgi:hypothetical protein
VLLRGMNSCRDLLARDFHFDLGIDVASSNRMIRLCRRYACMMRSLSTAFATACIKAPEKDRGLTPFCIHQARPDGREHQNLYLEFRPLMQAGEGALNDLPSRDR